MTRRQRHARLINKFDKRAQRAAIDYVLRLRGLDCFTDEIVENIAREIASEHRATQRRYQDNRKIMARASLAQAAE